MSKEHSSQHLDEEALPHSPEHDEALVSEDLEIELDDTLLDDTESDIDVSELDEYTKDEEPELDAGDNSDNCHDLYNLTLFELEHKLLITFTKLCDILEQLPSSSGPNGTDDALNSPTPNELFATAIHMAKSKNDVGAAKWMRRAAMSGHVRAQYYLGLMFAKGSGLPQSEYHAFTWLALAESQGSIEAVEAIAKLHSHLCTKQIKDARIQAASLYEQIHDQHFL